MPSNFTMKEVRKIKWAKTQGASNFCLWLDHHLKAFMMSEQSWVQTTPISVEYLYAELLGSIVLYKLKVKWLAENSTLLPWGFLSRVYRLLFDKFDLTLMFELRVGSWRLLRLRARSASDKLSLQMIWPQNDRVL